MGAPVDGQVTDRIEIPVAVQGPWRKRERSAGLQGRQNVSLAKWKGAGWGWAGVDLLEGLEVWWAGD